MSKIKILIPMEDSSISRRAIGRAIARAQDGAAEIFLFAVGDPKKFGKLGGKALADALHREIEGMRSVLTSVIVEQSREKRLDLDTIGRIHHRFSVGALDTEILKMSGAITSDVILMGVSSSDDDDHGDDDNGHRLTAEVAASVLRRAPCSVYAMRSLDETFVVV